MIIVKAFAKLNLNLHILPERLANGYSEIKAINCRLSLADELVFEKQKGKIELTMINCHPELVLEPVLNLLQESPDLKGMPKPFDFTHGKQVRHDELGIPFKQNTIYQAAELLKKEAKKTDLGVRIKLVKNIPVKSGLGGESVDGAATLISLNKLWELNFSPDKLAEIGGKIGSDIYYCLDGRIGKIGGYGEKVKIIALKMPEIWGVIVFPEEKKPSTKWAYENLDRKKVGRHLYKLDRMIKAIKKKDKKEIIGNLFNDFEDLIKKHYPVVLEIKEDLKRVGALNSLMAGSGLSVIGFFENKNLAKEAKNLLLNKYQKVFLVKTI